MPKDIPITETKLTKESVQISIAGRDIPGQRVEIGTRKEINGESVTVGTGEYWTYLKVSSRDDLQWLLTHHLEPTLAALNYGFSLRGKPSLDRADPFSVPAVKRELQKDSTDLMQSYVTGKGSGPFGPQYVQTLMDFNKATQAGPAALKDFVQAHAQALKDDAVDKSD